MEKEAIYLLVDRKQGQKTEREAWDKMQFLEADFLNVGSAS